MLSQAGHGRDMLHTVMLASTSMTKMDRREDEGAHPRTEAKAVWRAVWTSI